MSERFAVTSSFLASFPRPEPRLDFAPHAAIGDLFDLLARLNERDQLRVVDAWARRGSYDPRFIVEAFQAGVVPIDGSQPVAQAIGTSVEVESTSYPGTAQVDVSSIGMSRLFVRPVYPTSARVFAISFDGATDALVVDSVNPFGTFSWSSSPPTEIYLRAIEVGGPFELAVAAIEEVP